MDDLTGIEWKKEGFLGQQMVVLPPNSLEIIKGNDLIKDCYLTAIGFYPHAKFHDRKRKVGSNEYIFLYCTQGEGSVKIEGEKFSLKPNTYIIVPPFVTHHYKSSIDSPWTIYWVHFTGERAKLLFDRFCVDSKPVVKSIPYNETRSREFIRIINLIKFSFDEKTLEIINLDITHLIGGFIYHEEVKTKNFEKSMVNDSISYMKDNLDKTLKINELADLENLSVSRYSEIFRESTGNPPINYFNNLKIQKACQLLYFTDRSIKEIAVEFGFIDQYYFSRVFSKIMGVPPSKYRKNYKK
ncbi:helix-turn-helix domain-containing protein [Christiangramia marina]|uniref:helix-turn-helix domain-containing protein n=1 Tax=Christiangramia marina TaxID=409436 RepID=UPI003AA86FC2